MRLTIGYSKFSQTINSKQWTDGSDLGPSASPQEEAGKNPLISVTKRIVSFPPLDCELRGKCPCLSASKLCLTLCIKSPKGFIYWIFIMYRQVIYMN